MESHTLALRTRIPEAERRKRHWIDKMPLWIPQHYPHFKFKWRKCHSNRVSAHQKFKQTQMLTTSMSYQLLYPNLTIPGLYSNTHTHKFTWSKFRKKLCYQEYLGLRKSRSAYTLCTIHFSNFMKYLSLLHSHT